VPWPRISTTKGGRSEHGEDRLTTSEDRPDHESAATAGADEAAARLAVQAEVMSGTARCSHCGVTSPAAHESAGRTWFRQHRRQECAARRSGPTGTSRSALVGLERHDDAELAELLARAKQYKPIVIREPEPVWQDMTYDRWGARRDQRQLLARQWVGGNCVRACLASLLNAPIEQIPDPTVEYNEGLPGWFARYDKRVREATGHRLEQFPRSLCPPRNPNQLWIAGISMPDHDADHVVVARSYYTVFDPLGEFQGSLPWDRVIDGWILRPTTRIVPVLSPLGRGYTVVPA
jgi:hypothetical protein